MSSDETSFSFLARYGKAILSGGIAAIPRALYHYQRELGLTPQEVWFVSYILSYKWTEDLPHPSLVRMAEQSGVSYRSLHRYKDDLVAKGYLSVLNRATDVGGQDTNAYDFSGLFNQMANLLNSEKKENLEGGSMTPVSQGSMTPMSEGSMTPVSQGSMTPMSEGSMTPVSYLKEERKKKKTKRRTEEEANRKEPAGVSIRRPSSPENGAMSQKSDAIVRLMADFSKQVLHDGTHSKANITQAHNLWHESGLSEAEFMDVLYQAKQVVLLWSGRIQQESDEATGFKNRAPYFFKTLRNLLAEVTGKPFEKSMK